MNNDDVFDWQDLRRWFCWPLLFSLVAWVCVGVCAAQTVTVTNITPWPFTGWIRTTVDVQPPHRAGFISPCGKMNGDCCVLWVLGDQIVPGLWNVDLRVTLAPGQTRTVKLGETVRLPDEVSPDNGQTVRGRLVAGEMSFPSPQAPSDPIAFYGDWPKVNGVGMTFIAFKQDGYSFSTQWRCRIGRMFVVDLWLRNNGTAQPGLAFGEVSVTCSNPAVPDVVEVAPQIMLTVGDAIVWPLGGAPWEIVPAGTTFADGMTRTVPVTLTWLRHLGPLPEKAGDWLSALVAVNGGIVARGAKAWRAQ
jgi:hypothetical protein